VQSRDAKKVENLRSVSLQDVLGSLKASVSVFLEPLMPFVVVQVTPLPVTQNVIGFSDSLEFFLRIRILGIAVRMVSKRQLPKATLDLPYGGAFAETECFIVVSSGHQPAVSFKRFGVERFFRDQVV
jgi:hypothetical protein